MIKRPRAFNRRTTESLTEFSFTGTQGINVSKSPTSRETVLDMTNLDVDYDGGLRLRKPLYLYQDNSIIDGTKIPEILKIKYMYDNNYKIVLTANKIYCIKSEYNKSPISLEIKFYDNNTEEELLNIDSSTINFSESEVLNTTTSSILSGVKLDITKAPFNKYYDSTIYDKSYVYRYLRLEIKDDILKASIIIPEMNYLNSNIVPALNPNMSLDYAYAIRDNYLASVVSCEGILGYTLCVRQPDGTYKPTNSYSPPINPTVKVLTESDKEVSYKLISSLDKDFKNQIYLKAFLNIKASNKTTYICIWERTYDGVTWEEIPEFYENGSGLIVTVNIKDEIQESVDESVIKYTPKRYKRLNVQDNNDLLENRADCILIKNIDDATYRFTLRSFIERELNYNWEVKELIVNDLDVNLISQQPYLVQKEMEINGIINSKIRLVLDMEDTITWQHDTFSSKLFIKDYKPSTSNSNYNTTEKSYTLGTNLKVTNNQLVIENAIADTIQLDGFFKKIPSKIVIYKNNYIFHSIDLNMYFHTSPLKYIDKGTLLNADIVSNLLSWKYNSLQLGDFEYYSGSSSGTLERTKDPVTLELANAYSLNNTDKNSLSNTILYYLNITRLKESIKNSEGYLDFIPEEMFKLLPGSEGVGTFEDFKNYFNDNKAISHIEKNIDLKGIFKINNVSGIQSNINIRLFTAPFYKDTFNEFANNSAITFYYTSSGDNGKYYDLDISGEFLILYYKLDNNHIQEVYMRWSYIEDSIPFDYNSMLRYSKKYTYPLDGNNDFDNIGETAPTDTDKIIQEEATLLIDSDEYTLPISDRTEVLFNEYGSSVLGDKLYYKKAIYSYGLEIFKNNVFPSDTGSFITSLFNVIELDTVASQTVNTLIPWRDYLIAATDTSIYLINKIDTSYTSKTVNTFIGIPKKDKKTCRAILNGLLFKSGKKLYLLQPNDYSGNDTILNIKEISIPVENYIIEGTKENFAFTTEKAYYLFIPSTNCTLCVKYEYARGIWTKQLYPIEFNDYYIEDVSNIKLFSKDGKEYYFETDLRYTDSIFSTEEYQDYIQNLPYADYLDKTIDESYNLTQEEMYLADVIKPDYYKPIEFEIISGQKTDNISIIKQFVETKLIISTLNENDYLPLTLDIRVDGSLYPIHIDANTDAPIWKNSIYDKGSLSTTFTDDKTEMLNVLRQGYIRYSGKGKSISHHLKGSSRYLFKLYAVYFRYKTPNVKK